MKTTTIKIPVSDKTEFIHIITATGKLVNNVASPDSVLTRYSFIRVGDDFMSMADPGRVTAKIDSMEGGK